MEGACSGGGRVLEGRVLEGECTDGGVYWRGRVMEGACTGEACAGGTNFK